MKNLFAQSARSAARLARWSFRAFKTTLLIGSTALMAFAAHAAPASSEELAPCIKSDKPSEPYRWVVKATQPPEPYRWKGYNDKLVDACLGPNRYRIPANYFYDQMGPDFQGSVTLLMQWPDLQAPPPGKRSDAERAHTLIRSSLSYMSGEPQPGKGPLDWAIDSRYDLEHLDQRDKQSPRFGLTPYYVNEQKFLAYKKVQERIDGYESAYFALKNRNDWFLARDARGQLNTVIKCDSHLQPDGYAIQENRVVWVGPRGSSCSHEFVIPEQNVSVSVGYQRVFLKDWKRFEDHIRKLMTQYRVR